jgi:hypothetical protein
MASATELENHLTLKKPRERLSITILETGHSKHLPLLVGDVAIISETTASYSACTSKDITVFTSIINHSIFVAIGQAIR